jgi:prevent-host-death family protein
MDVGVRELKQHLSQYLDRAEGGQVITVTERGRPKALLMPLPGSGNRLAAGIDEGWITAAQRPGSLAPTKRATSSTKVADVVDLDRGE